MIRRLRLAYSLCLRTLGLFPARSLRQRVGQVVLLSLLCWLPFALTAAAVAALQSAGAINQDTWGDYPRRVLVLPTLGVLVMAGAGALGAVIDARRTK